MIFTCCAVLFPGVNQVPATRHRSLERADQSVVACLAIHSAIVD
jgi:hypothetical protein